MVVADGGADHSIGLRARSWPGRMTIGDSALKSPEKSFGVIRTREQRFELGAQRVAHRIGSKKFLALFGREIRHGIPQRLESLPIFSADARLVGHANSCC